MASTGCGLYLSIRSNLRVAIGALLSSDRPVDEEKVDIFELESLEGIVERPLDLVLLVQVVPDLGADEEIGSLDACVFLQEVLDGLTDFIFVEVEPGTIKMPVACLQGLHHGGISLSFGALIGKGTKPHSGHGNPIVQFESYS